MTAPTGYISIKDKLNWDGTVINVQGEVSEETVEAFLGHYGVKGQRWGVRRKNPSGGSSHLSNQELGKLVKRMQLEKSYSDVKNSPKQRTEGKAFAVDTLKKVGSTLATAAVAAAVSFAVQRALKQKFDVKAKTFAPPLPLRTLPPPLL